MLSLMIMTHILRNLALFEFHPDTHMFLRPIIKKHYYNNYHYSFQISLKSFEAC